MHNPVIGGIALAAAVILSACSRGGVSISVSEYETDGMKAYIELPEFSCISDDDFREEIEREYADYAAQLVSSVEGEEGGKSISITQEVTYTGNGMVSLYTDTAVEYSQKPVGTLSRASMVIDTENNRKIELDDLFVREDYRDSLITRMREQLQKYPDRYSGLWAMPDLENPQDFYLTDSALVLFYQPYKLSYYNKGIVEIEVPYSELRGYILQELQ